jgi:hypothetical protein
MVRNIILIQQPEERRLLTDLGIGDRLDLTKIESKGANWIHVAQERVQWQDLVKMIMNIPTSLKVESVTT